MDLQMLTKIKKEIETARTSASVLEGRIQEKMEYLQKEFGVASLEEADALLDEWNKEAEALSTALELKLRQLKEEFGK